MEDKEIKVNIRQNSGSEFKVDVKQKATVKELKEACATGAGIPAEEQRLIFKGMYNCIICFDVGIFRKNLEG